jgi:hypothetical protein
MSSSAYCGGSDHLRRAEPRASELVERPRSLRGAKGSFPLALRDGTVLRSRRIQPLDRIRRKPWLNRNHPPLASRSATSFQD